MSRVLSAFVLALLAGLLTSGPADADETYPVPDTATITVEGDGSGHGKGLSQYGAYGAAREGLKVGAILDFYYPGTRLGTGLGRIKVLISDAAGLVVEDRDGLTVRSLATGRTWAPREPRATRWRVRANGAGESVVSFRTGAWHTWRVLRGDAEFAAGGKPLSLRTSDGSVAYRGALRSVDHPGGRVTVNVLPMEQYLRGVVPAEVAAASWPQHAMRAQAVAARTYAAYEREHTTNPDYDLCDTAACQAYGGASAEYPTSDTAVAKTATKVLTHHGETAFAQYSASNGGWTVDGGQPYLPAQSDPYEGTSSDYYGWTVEVSAAEVEAAYNLGNLTSIAVETRDGHGPRGGRVLTVRLKTEGGFDGTVTGDSFRRNMGLPSTLFELTSVD